MSTIVTYPMNNIDFDDADVAAYNATRTSGVYSAADDFAVTSAGGLDVAVSAGIAWVHPERFAGYSICKRDPDTITLPMADSTRPRIDRLVLRYDAAAKKTSLTVLTGTPDSASPTAPEITRTALVYDLCLADIRRPAGSTVVTAADITDTRADEAVCGVMRDGVTGIPTAQLQAQALAIMTQLSTELHTKLDALDAAIAAVESGNFYTKSEADQKFGTPYSLPPAAADQLGGVRVGEALDIDADGTLSARSLKQELTDKIAASVAARSEPRLVWNTTVTAAASNSHTIKSYDIQIPDGVDYVHIKSKSERGNGTEVNIARGGSTYHSLDAGSVTTYSTTTFQSEGTLHFEFKKSTNASITFWVTGYHYPTLADLLTETQAAQADYDALDAEDSAIDAPDDVTQEE